jgi:hypothetical protein
MQLTEHMRNQLLESVTAAQKDYNPLLEGLDLNRLRRTLESDLTEDELMSLMLSVGVEPPKVMSAMCLTLIDRKTETAKAKNEDPAVPAPAPVRSWRVERPDHGGPLRARERRIPWKTRMKIGAS